MNTIINTTEVTLDTKPVRNKNAKSVYCITTGNVYASTIDAGIGEDCAQSGVSAACRGKTKTCNGKHFCFVKDMPIRVLDISNVTHDIYNDAVKYRKQEAERKAKEAQEMALMKKREKIEAMRNQIDKLLCDLESEQTMYHAMEKEFNV